MNDKYKEYLSRGVFRGLLITTKQFKGELHTKLKNVEAQISRILQIKYLNGSSFENLKGLGKYLQEIEQDYMHDANKIIQRDFPELAEKVEFKLYREVPFNQKDNLYLNDSGKLEFYPINEHPKNQMPISTPYPDLNEVISSVEMHLSKIQKTIRYKLNYGIYRIYGSIGDKKPKRLFKEFIFRCFDISRIITPGMMFEYYRISNLNDNDLVECKIGTDSATGNFLAQFYPL